MDVSNVFLLFGASGILVSLILLAWIYIFKDGNKTKDAEDEGNSEGESPSNASRRRRLVPNRNSRQVQPVSNRLHAPASSENDEIGIANNDQTAKIGKKKQLKLEAKAEKKAKREEEAKHRLELKKQKEIDDELNRKQEEAEREAEKQAEEERILEQKEKEKAEYEKYVAMKANFSVEEEGFSGVGLDDDGGNLLQKFVNHIKEQKIVILEDLASMFHLKTQMIIERIEELQNNGTLTGVIDDRGKFICVTHEELKAVADFVKKRGRVSIQELVENSNKLIKLHEATATAAC